MLLQHNDVKDTVLIPYRITVLVFGVYLFFIWKFCFRLLEEIDDWRIPVVAFLFPPLDSRLESTKFIFIVVTEISYYIRLGKKKDLFC